MVEGRKDAGDTETSWAGSGDKGATNQSGGISITARALELFLRPFAPFQSPPITMSFCFIYVTKYTEK